MPDFGIAIQSAGTQGGVDECEAQGGRRRTGARPPRGAATESGSRVMDIAGVDRRDHDKRQQVVDDGTVSMNVRRRPWNRGPTSTSIPSAKAVSVDIAAPQPCAVLRPALIGR